MERGWRISITYEIKSSFAFLFSYSTKRMQPFQLFKITTLPYPHLIYDIANQLPRFGLILRVIPFVVAGIVLYLYGEKLSSNELILQLGIKKQIFGRRFAIVYLSIATFMFVAVSVAAIYPYFAARYVYNNKQYQVVEGTVQDYQPMPESGHQDERFTVGNIGFAFSDFDLTDYGYNNAASHGGAIKPGLKVRITYFDKGRKNVILKLETE